MSEIGIDRENRAWIKATNCYDASKELPLMRDGRLMFDWIVQEHAKGNQSIEVKLGIMFIYMMSLMEIHLTPKREAGKGIRRGKHGTHS